MADLPVAYRAACPDDMGLIYHSWLRSYREHNHDARQVDQTRYYEGHKRVIARLLDRSALVVCCSAETPSAIWGWACVEPPVLHYCYVKQDYRGLGVAKGLLKAAGLLDATITISHLTREMHAWRGKGLPYVFDPYLLMEAR